MRFYLLLPFEAETPTKFGQVLASAAEAVPQVLGALGPDPAHLIGPALEHLALPPALAGALGEQAGTVVGRILDYVRTTPLGVLSGANLSASLFADACRYTERLIELGKVANAEPRG